MNEIVISLTLLSLLSPQAFIVNKMRSALTNGSLEREQVSILQSDEKNHDCKDAFLTKGEDDLLNGKGLRIEDPYDESTDFSDAETLYFGNVYGRRFHFAGDHDYYTAVIGANEAVGFFCSVSTYQIGVFKYNSSLGYWENYSPYTTFPTENYFFPESGTYCFVFTNYASGDYYFLGSKKTLYAIDAEKYFIRKRFFSNGSSTLSLVEEDYSNAPSYGSKSFSFTSESGVSFSTATSSNSLVKNGYNDWRYYKFVAANDFVLSGIFASNGSVANTVDDDDRTFVNAHGTYPASAVLRLVSNVPGQPSATGTGFFVDDDYAFTAGHMVCQNSTFASSLTAYVGVELTSYTHVAPVLTFYLPYRYYLYGLRSDDWCVLRIDCSGISSSYNHGYFGIDFDEGETSLANYIMGFPAYDRYDPAKTGHETEDETEQRDEGNHRDPTAPDDNNYRNVCAGGLLSYYNGFYRTKIDFTEGQSGGPSFKWANGGPYAQGLVSGLTDTYWDGSYNDVAPINRYNFGLLSNLITGVVS